MSEFFKNIGIEFKKITWPTDKEMRTYVTQVFAFMAILIVFFGIVDGLIARGVAIANPVPITEEYEYDDYENDDDPTDNGEED